MLGWAARQGAGREAGARRGWNRDNVFWPYMCHWPYTYHGTFGPSGACHIRGSLFPSCQQLPLQPDVFRLVYMFPYIVNLTFSRCSFCEREISERPCHSALAFIFIVSCFFRDVLDSVLQMYILYYKVIHIYYISQWCLHPGCEACVITAQDIFFPIFAAGSLVPQWEITFLPVWQGSLLPLLQLPRTWKRQLQWKILWSVTKPFLVLHSGMSIICVLSK